MKRLVILGLSALLIGGGVSSCSSSENVVSGRIIQKRKYNKGFFKHPKKSINTKDIKPTELLVNSPAEKKTTTSSVENNKPTLIAHNSINSTQTPARVVSKTKQKITPSTVKKQLNSNQRITPNKIEKVASRVINHIKKTTIKKSNLTTINHQTNLQSNTPLWLLYVLAILIPFISVGLATKWNGKLIFHNILLTLLFGIGGIIHAFVIISRNK